MQKDVYYSILGCIKRAVRRYPISPNERPTDFSSGQKAQRRNQSRGTGKAESEKKTKTGKAECNEDVNEESPVKKIKVSP